MSHEIRTPLNGIIGFSRLLNVEYISKEDIKEITAIITLSGKRLLEIVNNVLGKVADGGYFLYITCSVFKKENEEITEFDLSKLTIDELNVLEKLIISQVSEPYKT